MNAHHDLQRFLTAQEPVFENALAELEDGRKRSHWMWFVFPQLKGLGHSEMAQRYAIASEDEAAEYLAHPILGPRLRECAGLVAQHGDVAIDTIFHAPDDLKFHSSMTLFADVAPDEAVFQTCLDTFFDGLSDSATLARI